MTNWFEEAIQNVVALDEWQKLRKSFLGTWKESPVENVKKLRKFLGGVKTADDRRLRIVQNYLTGTGFRLKTITHPEITKLRNEVIDEIRRRKEERYG